MESSVMIFVWSIIFLAVLGIFASVAATLYYGKLLPSYIRQKKAISAKELEAADRTGLLLSFFFPSKKVLLLFFLTFITLFAIFNPEFILLFIFPSEAFLNIKIIDFLVLGTGLIIFCTFGVLSSFYKNSNFKKRALLTVKIPSRFSPRQMKYFPYSIILISLGLIIFSVFYENQPQTETMFAELRPVYSITPVIESTDPNVLRENLRNVSLTEPLVVSSDAEAYLIFLSNADQSAIKLPEDFNRFEQKAPLNEETELGSINFSTKIGDDYQAIDPTNIFAVGSYTVYAAFPYEGMEDGMEWAWVWRHDGKVVDGGNEIWRYGEEGPGYIYYNPEGGFEAGEYTLEIWVNEELLSRSNLRMTGSALSSGPN